MKGDGVGAGRSGRSVRGVALRTALAAGALVGTPRVGGPGVAALAVGTASAASAVRPGLAVAQEPAVPRGPAQSSSSPERVYVEDGVMRWESGGEVSLFGVNYYPAFSQSYRALERVGKDHREAIDEDVYHLARLGLDALRVHLYDIEITDSLGNLLENRHLDLHDYTIHRMSQRGIWTIITPTTYYDAGWPDGNVVEPPGFANYIDKASGPRVPAYRAVIKNYLSQLIHHVNPYTGLSAAEDPNVIGLEIDNEPSHGPDVDQVRAFVDEMADHLRASGWEKPIFYNISHSFDVTDAFLDADIDGVTFQWYPAGLYEGRLNRRNYFPYLNEFRVPFQDDPRYRSKALMVYEFDPADAMHAYALPMMARSFREAGMQFAAQFAYTPMAIAHVNPDWRSHYLNMVYTPRKAVAMSIASEVFHRVERRQPFDDYPADTIFGDFTLSHHRPLAQLNAPDAFLHTHDTDASPVDPGALERIAGVGSSPVVWYPGTGAYFLDRLDDGVWRLEVMPDAILVRNPFEAPGFERHVAHVEWREHPMRIDLADLGGAFSIEGLNEGNARSGRADRGRLIVSPGAYLLTRDGADGSGWTPDRWFRGFRLGEYHAAPPTEAPPAVRHRPAETAVAGRSLTITADIAGLHDDITVAAFVLPSAGQGGRVEMGPVSPHRYEAEIPARMLTTGELRYWIVAGRGDAALTFPGGHPAAPWAWNFHWTDDHWRTLVVDPGAPIPLWDAGQDRRATFLGFPAWGDAGRSDFVSTDRPGAVARRVSSTRPTGHRHVVGFGTYVRDRLAGMDSVTLDAYAALVVRGKSEFDNPAPVRVVLVDTDGNGYGADVPVTGTFESHRIPLSAFEPDRFMLLPQAYPTIMASWFATGAPGPVRPDRIQEIQFYIDTSAAVVGRGEDAGGGGAGDEGAGGQGAGGQGAGGQGAGGQGAGQDAGGQGRASVADGAPYGFAIESAWLEAGGTER